MFSISEEDRAQAKKVIKNFTIPKSAKDIFYNLCFCICAPQTTFASNKEVLNNLIIRNYYKKDIPSKELEIICRPVRFYRQKAERLQSLKKNFHTFYKHIKDLFLIKSKDGTVLRDYLEKNINGLGMKASSHFCRNMGYFDVAIIDTHVLKYMGKRLKDISTAAKYKKIEKEFKEQAEKLKLTVGELDAIIWKYYSNTPWEEFRY